MTQKLKQSYAKVFKSGNSQAIRIPKEFRLKSREVKITKKNNQLILEEKPQTAEELFHLFSQFSEDFFSEGRQQLPLQERDFKLD